MGSMSSSDMNDKASPSSNPSLDSSKATKKTTKKRKTKSNAASPSSTSSNTNSTVVSISKLDSILEHEFANKRVTRSMQQEAKKIKREFLRKERKKNKKVIFIEISDDDDDNTKEETKNKKQKVSSRQDKDSKANIKLLRSNNSINNNGTSSNRNPSNSGNNTEIDSKSRIRKIKSEEPASNEELQRINNTPSGVITRNVRIKQEPQSSTSNRSKNVGRIRRKSQTDTPSPLPKLISKRRIKKENDNDTNRITHRTQKNDINESNNTETENTETINVNTNKNSINENSTIHIPTDEGSSSRLQTDEDSSHFQTDEDSTRLQTDEDSTNIPLEEETTNSNTDEDSTNIQLEEENIKIQTDDDSIKIQTDEDSSKIQDDEDSSKIQIDEDSSKITGDEEVSNFNTDEELTNINTDEEITLNNPKDHSQEKSVNSNDPIVTKEKEKVKKTKLSNKKMDNNKNDTGHSNRNSFDKNNKKNINVEEEESPGLKINENETISSNTDKDEIVGQEKNKTENKKHKRKSKKSSSKLLEKDQDQDVENDNENDFTSKEIETTSKEYHQKNSKDTNISPNDNNTNELLSDDMSIDNENINNTNTSKDSSNENNSKNDKSDKNDKNDITTTPNNKSSESQSANKKSSLNENKENNINSNNVKSSFSNSNHNLESVNYEENETFASTKDTKISNTLTNDTNNVNTIEAYNKLNDTNDINSSTIKEMNYTDKEGTPTDLQNKANNNMEVDQRDETKEDPIVENEKENSDKKIKKSSKKLSNKSPKQSRNKKKRKAEEEEEEEEDNGGEGEKDTKIKDISQKNLDENTFTPKKIKIDDSSETIEPTHLIEKHETHESSTKSGLLEDNTAINNIAEKINIFNQLLNQPNTSVVSPVKKEYDSTKADSKKIKKENEEEEFQDEINGKKILRWTYETLPDHVKKYWHQRYSLFSKFDEGIMLDEESWFSVTHEKIAKHIAKRCKCNVIVDGFCGAGGNSIQFAKYCKKVISIDIDPVKIECAKNNARIYGVEDKIEFVNGNFLELLPTIKEKYHPDVIFISPPWGGPSYLQMDYYDLSFVQPVDGIKLFNMVKTVTDNIAYYLPRNCDYDQIRALAGPGQICELEQEYLNDKMRSFTIYFGDLVNTVNPVLLENYEESMEQEDEDKDEEDQENNDDNDNDDDNNDDSS